MSAVLPTAMNRPPLDRERLGPRRRRIHRVDLRVEHDEVGVGCLGARRVGTNARVAKPRRRDGAGDAHRSHAKELSPAVSIGHGCVAVGDTTVVWRTLANGKAS